MCAVEILGSNHVCWKCLRGLVLVKMPNKGAWLPEALGSNAGSKCEKMDSSHIYKNRKVAACRVPTGQAPVR